MKIKQQKNKEPQRILATKTRRLQLFTYREDLWISFTLAAIFNRIDPSRILTRHSCLRGSLTKSFISVVAINRSHGISYDHVEHGWIWIIDEKFAQTNRARWINITSSVRWLSSRLSSTKHANTWHKSTWMQCIYHVYNWGSMECPSLHRKRATSGKRNWIMFNVAAIFVALRATKTCACSLHMWTLARLHFGYLQFNTVLYFVIFLFFLFFNFTFFSFLYYQC